jgi:hypothetical protein
MQGVVQSLGSAVHFTSDFREKVLCTGRKNVVSLTVCKWQVACVVDQVSALARGLVMKVWDA